MAKLRKAATDLPARLRFRIFKSWALPRNPGYGSNSLFSANDMTNGAIALPRPLAE